MAGGQLVPHVLPNGQTIMVPGYLAPKQALALPNVAPPGASPDMRVAGPGGGPMAQWGNEIPSLPAPTQAEEAADMRRQIAGQQPVAPVSTNTHASKPQSRESELASLGGKNTGAAGVDPSTVVIGKPQARAQESGDDGSSNINPGARLVMDAARRSGGGGGPRRPGQMEMATIKEEREPGRQLLPEQMWRAGLAERPAELYERDPNVPVSTIGTDDPVMREKLTGAERAAKGYADRGVAQFQQQENDRHELALAQKQSLLDQSNLMDEQLKTVAARRERIAKLQEITDQRAQEASSMEPRTRQQIWESKGDAAQILGALAMAIGGAARGLGRNGGHNGGLEMVNKFLDSAVEDERYKHESRKKMGMEAKSDLDKAMAIYGDLEMATLDVKNRKIANVMAMTQNMMADRGLDATAKDRGQQLWNQLNDQLLEGIRTQREMAVGRVTSQEVNYKQGAPTGGGPAPKTELQILEEGARGGKAWDSITGKSDQPKANPTEQAALNSEEANMAPLKDLLARYKGTDVIPGVQPKGAPKRALRGAIDFVAGEGAAAGALDSEEERANRIIVERAALAYRHKMTGAGGSAKEMAGIDQAFAGARTRADLEQAVRVSEQAIAEQRRLSSGGSSNAKAPAATPSTFRPE